MEINRHDSKKVKVFIIGCVCMISGCFLITWGFLLLAVGQATFISIVISPLFWGLILFSTGGCAILKSFLPRSFQQFTAKCKVTEVIDGDTFKVSPKWEWGGQAGDTVRPLGYDAPEKGHPGYETAKKKLENLVLEKEVELRNPAKLSYQRLLCAVYFGGKNLASFFPEYQ